MESSIYNAEAQGHAGFEAVHRKDGRVQVRLTLTLEVANRLNRFLREKGFRASDIVPVLIEYGLDSQDEDALKELREERDRELPKIDSKYAVIRFQNYECFIVNQAIAMRLHTLLSENRRLKRLCRAEGIMNTEVKDAWDSWGVTEVDDFYKRYVFKSI